MLSIQNKTPRRRRDKKGFTGLSLALLALVAVIGLATTPTMAQDKPDASPEVEPLVEALTERVAATVLPSGGAVEMVYAGDDDDGNPQFVSPGQYRANNIWVLIAAALVFIMHLGFGCVETGLTRAKNSVNVLTKNLWIICTGVLLYWVWGFNAHYPSDWVIDGILALPFPAPWLDPTGDGAVTASYYGGSYTIYTDFIFQAMFAATAATIVSGAVAERIKLPAFMIFAVVFVGFGYPFVGSWHWGGGGLGSLPTGAFYDFAGSSVVHAFGGWGALAGVILLGPRLGKYGSDGSIKGIPGHNLPLVNVGVFLLFLGWFGFNGGSVLSADEAGVSFVFVTTALAGFAGGMVALLTSWGAIGKPDLTMGLNGMLAGLVGITAGADSISPGWSIVVGGIAGVLVVVSVLGFDRIKIDDPVGAISVHGVCGVWGTLAVGIFSSNPDHSFVSQLIGTVLVSVTAFLIAFAIFGILKVAGGIRVSEEEEVEGLDLGEHGMGAYHTLTPGS
ncbi:MAG: ammonium transporter [Planctomycetota bacterium]